MLWLLLTITLAVASLLSKEIGITVLVICAAFDAFVTSNLTLAQSITSLLIGAVPSHTSLVAIRAYRIRVLILAVMSITLVALRLQMNQGNDVILNQWEYKAVFHPDMAVRALSRAYYAYMHMWLLIYPNHLCHDWSFDTIPLLQSLYDPRVLEIAAMLIVFTVVAITAFKGAHRSLLPLKMGLVVLLLTYLPSSGLLFNVAFVVAERIMYTPRSIYLISSHNITLHLCCSIGYSLVLVWFVGKLRTSKQFVLLAILMVSH